MSTKPEKPGFCFLGKRLQIAKLPTERVVQYMFCDPKPNGGLVEPFFPTPLLLFRYANFGGLHLLLFEQIGMRSCAMKCQHFGIVKIVDQEPIGLNMALPEALPFARKHMRPIP
jgi:hypothetical protein